MTQTYTSDFSAPARGSPTRLIAAMIAGFTALVFAGSYLAGRSARPSEGARPPARTAMADNARAPRAADPPATEAAPVETAPAADVAAPPALAAGAEPGPFADVDLGLLHPVVAAAVVEARAMQASAVDAAARAQEAADRARRSERGAGVINYASGDLYEGEVRDGGRHGVGVYTWANPQEDFYAGEFVDDAMEGMGVKRWSDGATYYGDRRSEAREGYGVFVYADGGGYEGAWRSGAPNGRGVVWNVDGSVRFQGLWADNTLIEAWIVPSDEAAEAGVTDEAALDVGGVEVGGPAEAAEEPADFVPPETP
jgi:hypothetical protein